MLLCQKVKARPWTLAGLRPSGSHSEAPLPGMGQGWEPPTATVSLARSEGTGPRARRILRCQYHPSVTPVSCSVIALYLGKWTVGLLLKRLETPAWILLANEHFIHLHSEMMNWNRPFPLKSVWGKFKGEEVELSEIFVLVDKDMLGQITAKLKFPILTSHLCVSSHVSQKLSSFSHHFKNIMKCLIEYLES